MSLRGRTTAKGVELKITRIIQEKRTNSGYCRKTKGNSRRLREKARRCRVSKSGKGAKDKRKRSLLICI